MDIQLGPLRPHDRARVAELLLSTEVFSGDEIAVALQLFDASVAERALVGADDAQVLDYEFTGAFEGEQLIGYACAGPTPATEGTFDLYWLAVEPMSQGRGVGRTLVREVERDLRSRGARLLLVETSSRPDYENTRKFYERCGYIEAARIRDFYAPADDRIMLTTRLSSFTTRERGAATR
ncbi:MAG: GNAT family N-acetyltransferase [Gemmatimonadaceae bacterium]